MAPTPTTGAFAWAANGSVTPPLPAGVAAGDVLLVFAMVRNTGQTFTTPDTYTILGTLNQQTNICVIVYGKTAGVSETAAPTVISSQATTQPTGAIVVRCTQADLAGITIDDNNSSAAGITFPSVTTSVDDALVLRVVCSADDNTVTADAATPLAGEVTVIGSDAAMWLWHDTQAVAGTVPTDTATLAGGDAWISWTVAVPSTGTAVLVVDNARAATRASSPVLAQATAILVDGARALTRTSSPLLGQATALVVDNARALTRASSPLLGGPQRPAPERTYTVPAEDRTHLVLAESRTHTVPADPRTATA